MVDSGCEKARVYLAGAIQHSQSKGKGWRRVVKEKMKDIDGLEPVSPIDKYDSTDEAAEWEDEKIVAEDRDLIDTCDAILIHYEKVPSHGTPREQEYVRHLGEMADFVEALEANGVDTLTIERALDDIDQPWPKHLPIVVQTTADELSPWLTVDAYAIEESFDEAVRRLKGAFSGLYPKLREA